MVLDVAQIIGYTGSALTFLGMVAQIRHCIQRDIFGGLSASRMAADVATNSMNLAYGIMIENIPVCLTAASVIGGTTILAIGYCQASLRTPLPEHK